MKKLLYKLVVMLLIGTLLVSSYFLFKYNQEDKQEEELYQDIQEIAEISENEEIAEDKETTEKIEEIEENNKIAEDKITPKENNIDFTRLSKINNDIVAWIKIQNTQINYPVMQNKENPEFYLTKNFYKKYSTWGTPFLDEKCDVLESDNLIIYGHHIKNNKMFGELEKYRKQEYYKTHKYIEFYTKEEKSKYEIISVFCVSAEGNFKYYNFIKPNNNREFEIFIKECQKLSFYNTQNTAQYGDKLITLSTCDYTIKNGRLVVVAKRL